MPGWIGLRCGDQVKVRPWFCCASGCEPAFDRSESLAHAVNVQSASVPRKDRGAGLTDGACCHTQSQPFNRAAAMQRKADVDSTAAARGSGVPSLVEVIAQRIVSQFNRKCQDLRSIQPFGSASRAHSPSCSLRKRARRSEIYSTIASVLALITG